jgi:hypothetical protein
MDLDKICEEIVVQVQYSSSVMADRENIKDYVKEIVQRKIVDVLEPENVYQKGEYYEGLGTYIGIVDTYPWNQDYFRREHCFSKDMGCENLGKVCEINRILIREIRK